MYVVVVRSSVEATSFDKGHCVLQGELAAIHDNTGKMFAVLLKILSE